MASHEHGALIGSGSVRSPEELVTAMERLLVELGFAPASERTELEVVHLVAERGGWVQLGVSAELARALTRRLAARLDRPIQLYTATVRHSERGEQFECDVDDVVVRPGGQVITGTLARELEAECGGDWGQLCDGKPYFALRALLDCAVTAWIPTLRDRRTSWWLPPPSLGDRRLDDLALRVRVAVRAQLTTIDGRACVRTTTGDAATTTSFLSPDELARLRGAVGALLADD